MSAKKVQLLKGAIAQFVTNSAYAVLKGDRLGTGNFVATLHESWSYWMLR